MDTTATVQQHRSKVTASNHSTPTSRRGRGRPRASLACGSCRLRKVKCDVQSLSPGTTCTPCRASDTKCVVDGRDDRRKGQARNHFDHLQGRLEKLEALLSKDESFPKQQFERKPSNSGMNGEETTHGSLPALNYRQITPVCSTNRNPVPQVSEDSDTDSKVNVAPHIDRQRPLLDHRQHSGSESKGLGQHEAVRPHLVQQRSSAGSATLDQASVAAPTEETVPCLDFDQIGGQTRYYGPASRLYIHESRHAIQESVQPEEDSDFTITLDSPQIQKQLLFLFWQVPVLPAAVVDETLFRAGLAAAGRSQYFSDFLLNSLLACGSRASTSSTLRNLGERYIERAKKQIAQEIERPNVASLQGFLLLSDFEATQGRDRVGWIYCGTACRLLFDLGLHEDCSGLLKQGRLTAEDAGMRRNAFFVTFIFEKFWKLYLGRPSSVNEASLDAVRKSTQDMKANPTVDAYVSLCVQVSSVTDFVNSPASYTSTSEVKARITELDARIQSCYDELPTSLKTQGLNGSEMEIAAYGINMQFCGIRIVLHRVLNRFESDRHGKTVSRIEANMDPNLVSSNKIIHDNAVQIARLTSAYRQIFGADRVATIMLDNMRLLILLFLQYVAAQALIQHIVWLESRDLSQTADLQWIRLLADTMEDVVPHYPVTMRMRWSLAKLVASNTSMSGLFGDYPREHAEQSNATSAGDFGLAAGAWDTFDSFFAFDLTEPENMNIDSGFTGN